MEGEKTGEGCYSVGEANWYDGASGAGLNEIAMVEDAAGVTAHPPIVHLARHRYRLVAVVDEYYSHWRVASLLVIVVRECPVRESARANSTLRRMDLEPESQET